MKTDEANMGRKTTVAGPERTGHGHYNPPWPPWQGLNSTRRLA